MFLMNSTRQGDGSSSWTVGEKRGGPGTTVKRKQKLMRGQSDEVGAKLALGGV